MIFTIAHFESKALDDQKVSNSTRGSRGAVRFASRAVRLFPALSVIRYVVSKKRARGAARVIWKSGLFNKRNVQRNRLTKIRQS